MIGGAPVPLVPRARASGAAGDPDEVLQRSNLATSQFLIWLGQQLHPDSPLYNMALAFDIEGALDAMRFQRAFEAVAARSDALRTVFHEADGIPMQHVGMATPGLEHIDLAREPEPERALRALLETRARRPFALHEPLVDAALIRLAPERHVWWLCQHHIVTDAWATALVYRRVADGYRHAEERPEPDPPFPPYAGYVEHERRLRGTPLFGRIREHWRRTLEQAPGRAPLYGHFGEAAGTRTERLSLEPGPDRSRAIHALSARLGARSLTGNSARFELFATVLFAWLARVSGRSRLSIGAPAHNRSNATLKETIGPCIELFPMVAELDEQDTFATLHERVRTEMQRFLRYAQPGASSPRLLQGFNVVLNYIHATFTDFAGLPMRSEWVHSGHGDPRHHLRLQVHDFDATGSIALHFDFHQDLFGADQRNSAAGHFVRLLDAMLADPEQCIHRVSLAGEAERLHVAPAGHADTAASHEEATVVAMIRAQAARTPHAIALSCGSDDVTYAQLLRSAGRIAEELRRRGVGPESRVGLHLERSAEAVTAILAVLIAGGAWVPLPPDDPPDRTAFLLHDADVRVVLTHSSVADRLPPSIDAAVLRVDDEIPGQNDGTVPAAAPAAHDAAYVLHTSGSTGRPKGVVIEHASLATYIAWARSIYLRGRALDFPLFTALSFDLTLTSIFLPLVSGGRIVVYPESEPGAATLLRIFQENRVDAIKLTPSHLSLLAGSDFRGSRVRLVIVGGEDLRREQAAGALRTLGDAEIHNEYGPTETTVACTVHRFDPQTDVDASVPIGRAAPHARVYVLDAGHNPVPAGVTGEIYIAGAGVGRGYLGRPDLTAQRFLPDTVAGDGRMYRTGDLGRWSSDGVLQFLGRADDQVKVRGARVEPAEVESALLAHPAVRACVVMLDANEPAGEDRPATHCVHCGLPSNYPGATFDGDGVCHLCRGFARYRERVAAWFRSMEDLRGVLADARERRRGEHDCVMLLSGGKDSTYALCRLVEAGASVLAFTLDNGYLSESAKANIRRVTASLGVEHIFGTTPAMNAIFVDSLERHANVCNGCFKTLYTLGARLARERGIPLVITGLSRGQFFETRLTEELFRDDAIDADRIDRVILEARKAYHRSDDAVARLLDTRDFRDDRLFEEVRFIDFYRYCAVELDEMLRFLAERVPWVRPEDTGRSTNCLINEVGIFMHRRRRGFHNYAFPYSWDVRVGHKTRDAALDELTDEPDAGAVRRILGEIGYRDGIPDDAGAANLVAFVQSDDPVPADELRGYLARTLPQWMLPSRFVRVDRLPLTRNGKVDRAALRLEALRRPRRSAEPVAPRGPVEERIAAIWAEVLGLERVGVLDGFLDLGGNSLVAIRIIARVNDAFGIELPLRSAFEAATVATLARLVEDVVTRDIAELGEEEAVRLAGRPPVAQADPSG